ncbi:MAG: type II/IV secretion system protein [Parcubacteria group bacterium]|nr:type II/IV secretion system protein [Parcubacteria group bacterium]
MVTFSDKTQQEKLATLRLGAEEREAERKAAKSGANYANLAILAPGPEAIGLIPEDKSRRGYLAVIGKTAKNLKIAVFDPENAETKIIISELKNQGYAIQLLVVSLTSLNKAWRVYERIRKPVESITGKIIIHKEELEEFKTKINNLEVLEKKFKTLEGFQLVKILEFAFAGAVTLNASDIHFEAQEKEVRLRLRIDGSLQDIFFFNPKIYNQILSRIKLLAGLKINIRDRAQDGRFTILLADESVEVRVALAPGAWGENIVLRILNPKAINVELNELGFRPDALKTFEREIVKPNGMIVMTGPTGSGKTTTLYAFLKRVYSPEMKIITVEDPVEYHLAGITQTQVAPDKGYTFATALRSILRQDPDVILIGEMRDKETAEIALQSALTGHLVFSTLHTNDAAGTIPRLIEMDMNPAIIAAAFNLAVAQRLVRKLCQECKKEDKLTQEELKKIKTILKNVPANFLSQPLNAQTKIFRETGCPECNNTGYKGRVAIVEILEMNEKMKNLILSSPSQFAIQDLAIKKGMITLKQDGFLKILQGLTSINEVESVVG